VAVVSVETPTGADTGCCADTDTNCGQHDDTFASHDLHCGCPVVGITTTAASRSHPVRVPPLSPDSRGEQKPEPTEFGDWFIPVLAPPGHVGIRRGHRAE